MNRTSVLAICCLFASLVAGQAARVWASDAQQAAALFRQRCVKCHGPLEPEGALDLSTMRGVARGGESGVVIVAGDIEQSPLWQRVAADEMPPDEPLPADEKEVLRQWIAGGAVGLPAAADDEYAGADHWAFQTLLRAEPPVVASSERIRTSVDRFVQAQLEARGLSLGPDADPRTLIRRVSLDLTGLPPTLAEIELYLSEHADGAEDAYERMVQRYLASPRYGERWGKHWLDAAGYADSNGYFSADTDRPLAYRYRDYVIRSMNEDKPFDRFITEQLAGDELAAFEPGKPTTPEAIELLIATHFLRNGQDGTDIGVQEPEAFEVDRRAALEAVVQVTASSLLGLTLHCARCHDHKFEPITQKEYYQFQAIMFPAFNPQDWVNPQDRIVHAYLPGEKEAWQQQEQQITSELATLKSEFEKWLDEHREPAELLLAESFDDDAWQSRWSATAPGDDQPGGVISIGGDSANAARSKDGALQIIAGPGEAWLSTTQAFDWTPATRGSWIQATFDVVADNVGGAKAERLAYNIAVHDFDDSSARQSGNLLIDGHPSAATSVYRDYPGSDQQVIGQIGEQGYEPGRNYGVRVTNIDDGKYRLEHLVDGMPDGKSLELTEEDLPDGGFAFFFCCQRSFVVDGLRIERSLDAPSDPQRASELADLRKQIEARRKQYREQREALLAKRTPEPGRAIAWVTDKSANPPEVPLLTRGLYHLRGELVEPGALQVLTDPEYPYEPQRTGENPRTTGRRLGFAQWLLRPESRSAALVARVHANRIWRQYFGRGIVATTDNLGQSGAAPSHPELLDHLAASLVDSGWSQKRLHHLIVTSTVYRQSSASRPEGMAADPDNRYWWRWPLRRLEAEVIRDSMLLASGQVDLTSFGPYVPTHQTPVGEVIVQPDGAGARRRSVYLQQRRSQTMSLLKVFDAPSIATVCSSRPSSTVPLQSLALLNSDFAVFCGESFARQLLSSTDRTPEGILQRAWQVAVGRPPDSTERELSLQFMAAQRAHYPSPEGEVWAVADFCQMLLASNAFLYVE